MRVEVICIYIYAIIGICTCTTKLALLVICWLLEVVIYYVAQYIFYDI